LEAFNLKGESVVVTGVGQTKFGKLNDQSLSSLIYEAASKTLFDACITRSQIDALVISNLASNRFNDQQNLTALCADVLGLSGIPAFRAGASSASGAAAIQQAVMMVKSGIFDNVLVIGVELMNQVSTDVSTSILANSTHPWEQQQGITIPALAAMLTRLNMLHNGLTREQLALVAVKNHRNALINPLAHFHHKKVSFEDVMNSPIIADPLRLFDFSPRSDGAASVIISSEKSVKKFCEQPIYITGIGASTDVFAYMDRENLMSLDATRFAADRAFKMAEITQKEIDIVEVHDAFTPLELVNLEDIGFFEKGSAAKALEEGITDRDGQLPVNVSGGLKAKGHPVGATGIGQVLELTLQIRNEAGERQVTGVETGLAHAIGGFGNNVFVTILSRS
jgi:acetyl-CoA C-acetyltransferase